MIIECSVQQVHELFPDFDKCFKLNDNYKPYVLFADGIPVSCLCVALEGKKYAKIHACFTPVRYRRNGYLKELLIGVLSLYNDKTVKADCLPASIGVFLSCGFQYSSKRYCNGYTLYHTTKEGDKNGSSSQGD